MKYIHAAAIASIIFTADSCVTSPQTRSSGDPNVITRKQIEDTRAGTAYDVVARLRPTWLNPRTGGSQFVRLPWLYVDGLHRGNANDLRDFQSEIIEQIRYWSADDALIRWGELHPAGAIEVKTITIK